MEVDDIDVGGIPAYAGDLMVIHFLQRRKIVPILHELPMSEETKKSPGYLADLKEIQKNFQLPKSFKIGELWIDMLRFYAVENDNQNLVINIRQSKLLTREEKSWNKKRLAIEG